MHAGIQYCITFFIWPCNYIYFTILNDCIEVDLNIRIAALCCLLWLMYDVASITLLYVEAPQFQLRCHTIILYLVGGYFVLCTYVTCIEPRTPMQLILLQIVIRFESVFEMD